MIFSKQGEEKLQSTFHSIDSLYLDHLSDNARIYVENYLRRLAEFMYDEGYEDAEVDMEQESPDQDESRD